MLRDRESEWIPGVTQISTRRLSRSDDRLLYLLRQPLDMRSRPARPGAAPAELTLLKITARAGTVPPHYYSGIEVEYDGSGEIGSSAFEPKTGGITVSFRLINLQEIGDSGSGVRGLDLGSVVVAWPLGNGYYACSASHYRGTYG